MNNQLNRRKTSFSLIELLVVLAIIAAIAAITFRLITSAQEKAMKGKAIKILEMVAFALEDYRATYGIYPPVAAGTCPVHGNCQVCYFYQDINLYQYDSLRAWVGGHPSDVQLYAYGMLGHLLLRDRSGIYHRTPAHGWIPDTEHDVLEKSKWQHYLNGLWGTWAMSNTFSHGSGPYDSGMIGWMYDEIRDPWLRLIHYETEPPYLSYKLWSDGPDAGDLADDIHKDKWDN